MIYIHDIYPSDTYNIYIYTYILNDDRYGCGFRYFAELGGYAFQSSLTFEQTVMTEAATTHTKHPITFYDSVTGKPLFVAARHRTVEQFIAESKMHGWYVRTGTVQQE